MSDQYPITTRELVVIGFKELGKNIPGLGAVINAHDSVFGVIEINRIKQILDAVICRLEQLEAKTKKSSVLNDSSGQVLLYACDQARHDPLVDTKAKEYGRITVHYMTQSSDLNEVVEVLDAMRKLSADDLKILYQFIQGGQLLPNRRVDEIIGYSPCLESISKTQELQQKMTAAFPSFRRLEGLGVLYLADANTGGVVHNIGPLSRYMEMFAYLTPVGERLVRALPD